MPSRSPSSSLRLALSCGALAGAAAVALPLGARTLTGPLASTGPEIVLASPASTPTGASNAPVGTDGTNFAVFCATPAATSGSCAQRISPTGALLDPVAVPVPHAPLAVAPSAGGYLLVWNAAGELVSAHLDASLTPVETTPTPVAAVTGNLTGAAIARGAGGGYLLAWSAEYTASGGTTYAVPLDASGAPAGDVLTLGTGATTTYQPAVAYAAGKYEVAWGADAMVLAVQVSAAGALLAATQATLTTSSAYTPPVLVAGATEHIVAWRNDASDSGPQGVYAARIAFDGTVLDPNGVEIIPSGEVCSLAYSTATGVVASWTDSSARPAVGAISEAHLALTPPGGSSLPAPLYTRSVLTSSGSAVLATWPGTVGTMAERLSQWGTPTPPVTTLGFVTGSNGAAQVASSGNGYLAAWVATGVGPASDYAVWARTLDASGTPLGQPILLSTAAYQASSPPPVRPQVVWTGQEYVVLVAGPADFATCVRVLPDGTVVDSTPRPLGAYAFYAGNILLAGGNDHVYAIGTGSAVSIWAFDGTPSGDIGTAPAPLTVNYTSTQAALAWIDATHFELAFVGPAALYGAVVDAAAMTARTPVVIDATAGLTQPLVARGHYETAVGVTPPTGSMVVYRLDGTGAVLDGPSATLSVPGTTGSSLVWDGARYVLAWGSAGDAGAVGFASDLGSGASRFALAGPLQPFGEDVAPPGPAIAPMGDGGAFLVATRALAGDTSVVGVAWTSASPLGPPPADAGPEAGVDAGRDAGHDGGPGRDAATEAGDAPDATDDGAADSAAPVGTDDAGDAHSPSPSDDAGTPGDAGEDASSAQAGSSGCSCRAGAARGGLGASWGVLLAMSVAARRFTRRARKR